MPIVSRAEEMPTQHSPAVTGRVFAGEAVFGRPVPMLGRRFDLQPEAEALLGELSRTEALLYVAAGAGSATADGALHSLETETTLWLTPGQSLVLRAGSGGLSILLAEAPG
ncbi:MAG: hypothetical protein ACYCZ8_18760 [Acidimicrobiales bacterium]